MYYDRIISYESRATKYRYCRTWQEPVLMHWTVSKQNLVNVKNKHGKRVAYISVRMAEYW